jgi:DNA-binding response OmpR family regulator
MSPRSRKSIPSPEGTATVLAASPLPADRVRLRQPFPPSLIVFSRLADEPHWAKVLNLGGFGVLITPFEPEEVLRVAFSTRSRWHAALRRAPRKRRKQRAVGECPHFRTNGKVMK